MSRKKTLLSLGMWRFFLLVFIFVASLLTSLVAQDVSSKSLLIDDWVDAERRQFFYKGNQENRYASNYDVKYYRLQVNIDPSIRFISGEVTIYFVPSTDISVFSLDCSDALTIDSIVSHNNGSFVHQSNQIHFSENFTGGVLDSLTVFYHGEPDSNSTAFVQSSHNSIPIIWTLSEPYGAMDWWPCKQSLTDKADSIDVWVKTPKGYKVAGNGLLQSETAVGLDKVTHWKCNYPIVAYLIAVAVTEYADISFSSTLSTGNLLVQNYVYKEDSSAVINELFATDTLLRLFDSLVGTYPFMEEKYGHAQFGRGGGMEHQTMSFMSHFGFSLNAHELAHQWFGDKVTCGSWSDLWLNEGFATYFTGVAYENLRSDSLWWEWKNSVLNAVVSEPDGSVYVTDTIDVPRLFDSRLTYRKGAYVLHMLRYQIGDELFYDAIRNYISDPDLAYKTALTDDFFSHVNEVTGADYSWFMNEWIYGQGYPSYNLEWEQTGSEVSFTMAQTTSHSSVLFYHNRVPILFTNSNGDSAFVEYTPQEIPSKETFKTNFEVEQVIIDPNLDIISKANFTINLSNGSEFKLYPIPTQEKLTVHVGIESNIISSYIVYDANGRLIRSAPFNPYQDTQIDVSKLPNGVYTIIFQGSGEQTVRKFVVSR